MAGQSRSKICCRPELTEAKRAVYWERRTSRISSTGHSGTRSPEHRAIVFARRR